MKRPIFWIMSLPMFIVLILLLACNRKMETATVNTTSPEPAATAPVPTGPLTAIPAPSANVEVIPSSPNPVQVPKPIAVATSALKMEDAYFDFDKSFIRSDAQDELDEDAHLLKENPDLKVKIEGHCDERGTSEYNLVLGNRRAETAKRYLVSLGIDPSHISIISYGKEKPFCFEHDETCYQQNRRDHFIAVRAGN